MPASKLVAHNFRRALKPFQTQALTSWLHVRSLYANGPHSRTDLPTSRKLGKPKRTSSEGGYRDFSRTATASWCQTLLYGYRRARPFRLYAQYCHQWIYQTLVRLRKGVPLVFFRPPPEAGDIG